MRWIFHVARAGEYEEAGPLRPASLVSEGFVHGSFAPRVEESASLYFPKDSELVVYAVDPRRLDVGVTVADTPRGPMPHVHGPIPRDAVRSVLPLAAFDPRVDAVRGTRVVFVAFPGITLLDLVSAHDAVTRIRRMKFDETAHVEIVGTVSGEALWSEDGARFCVSSVMPSLEEVDMLVIPGGPGASALATERPVLDWLATYPSNRIVASVCTGALVLGAMGRLRGKRATTHASALGELAAYGSTAVSQRVVDEGQVITAGGVTSGVDLGLALVNRLMGKEIRDAIARQMEVIE